MEFRMSSTLLFAILALGSLMSEILYPIGLFVLIGGVYILQHETKNFYGSDILSFLIDDNIAEEEDEVCIK